jgi:hypothetical protein
MFCPPRLLRAAVTTAHRTATPRDVPGSRLLPAHRAARLQSDISRPLGLRSARGPYDDSLPDEACGPVVTPAEESASQARRTPKIGERSRENEHERVTTEVPGARPEYRQSFAERRTASHCRTKALTYRRDSPGRYKPNDSPNNHSVRSSIP